MRPYAVELMKQQFNPKRIASEVFDAIKDYYRLLTEFPSEINEIIYKIKEGKFKTMIEVKGFEPLTEHIDMASNRVSAAIVVAALIIGASIISQWDQTRMAGIIVFSLAGILGFWLLVKLFRKNKF
jgi:ubiquinone biosynthesis protein